MLEIHDLQAGYGSGLVLHKLRLSLKRGEVVALMGRNGAGKSTMLKSIIGLVQPKSGTISFNGRDITGLAPHEKSLRGIGYVPEGRRMFAGLTVDEHLVATARPGKFSPLQIYRLFPALRDRRHQIAKSLSGGEQQMLAIGRGLMALPRLLMVDEPFLGLAPQVAQQLQSVFETLKSEGMAILFIEQNVRLALSMAGRGYILEGGRLAIAGPADTLIDSPEVRRIFLGV